MSQNITQGDGHGRPDAPRSRRFAALVNIAGPLLALAVVFTLFALIVPEGRFYQPGNIQILLIQSTVIATAAIGATLVIISGGIDLSVGSIIGLGAVVTAWTINTLAGGAQEVSWLVPLAAAGAAIAVGALCGLGNGLLITGLGIVPFIVTLGMLQLLRGLTRGLADERTVYTADTWLPGLMGSLPDSLSWMLLPPGVWIALAGALLVGGMLIYTPFGRHIVAIGSSEPTARLCGVPIARTKIMVYMLAGFFAGLAGLMEFSYSNFGDPSAQYGSELMVIAAVVIGGGSLAGGRGSIIGAVIGAVMMQTIAIGGTQMHWPPWIREVVTGAIIIAAIALDRLRRRKGG